MQLDIRFLTRDVCQTFDYAPHNIMQVPIKHLKYSIIHNFVFEPVHLKWKWYNSYQMTQTSIEIQYILVMFPHESPIYPTSLKQIEMKQQQVTTKTVRIAQSFFFHISENNKQCRCLLFWKLIMHLSFEIFFIPVYTQFSFILMPSTSTCSLYSHVNFVVSTTSK